MHHLGGRQTLLERRTGWGREQQAKDHQGTVGPNQSPLRTQHTSAPVPRVGHWAEVVQGRGRLLPPGAGSVGYLPLAWLSSARLGHCLGCGGGSRRISLAAALGSRRHGAGSPGVLGAAAPPRPVPGAERAGCLQELKLLCKEQRRRAAAGGGDRGAAPTARLQSPPPGPEPNGRWECRGRAAPPPGPGCTRLSTQGRAAGPEHPSQGRLRCRQRPRRQRQDPELRPTAPPLSPLRPQEGAAGQGLAG